MKSDDEELISGGTFEDIAEVKIKHLNFNAMPINAKLKLKCYYKEVSRRNRALAKALNRKRIPKRDDSEQEYIRIYQAVKKMEMERKLKIFARQIRDSPERREWLKEGHMPGSLKHCDLDPSFPSNIFPDQLPDRMITEYLETAGKTYAAVVSSMLSCNLKADILPRPMADSEFNYLLTESFMCKLIYAVNELENPGVKDYVDLFGISPSSYYKYFIMDTTIIRANVIQRKDGFFIAPSVVLLEQETELKNPRAVAIAIENLDHVDQFPPQPFPANLKGLTVLYPEDGLAWEMAKLHTVQNGYYMNCGGMHEAAHFNLLGPAGTAFEQIRADPISHNDSILANIIGAHTYMSVQINTSVFNTAQSVVFAQDMPTYAWNTDAELGHTIFHLYRLMDIGWENHPIYKFGSQLLEIRYHYNISNFRKLIFELKMQVDEFSRKIVDILGNETQEQLFFSDFVNRAFKMSAKGSFMKLNCGNWVESNCVSTSIMKKTLSAIIFSGMEHSLEHKLYEHPLFKQVGHLRIRKPVPFDDRSNDPEHVYKYIEDINTLADRAKHQLTSNLAFHDHSTKTCRHLFLKEGGYFSKVEHPRKEEMQAVEKEFVRELIVLFESDISSAAFATVGISIQS